MIILIGSETYYPNVNGASYFAQRLAAGLYNKGHDVHVLCPSQSKRSMLIRRNGVIIHGIPSLPVPLYKELRFTLLPFTYKHILDVVQRLRPDVIHIQTHFLIGHALTVIAHQLGIPIIATNHFTPENATYQILDEHRSRRINDWMWRDLVKVYNRVKTVTAPTSVAARMIKDKGITRTVKPISCGVDLDLFNPRNEAIGFRDKYNIPLRPTYMYVGRLDQEKHIDELINALPLVRKKVDAQLVIVGRGKMVSRLRELVDVNRLNDFVIFTGFIEDEDLPKVYMICDVFCIAGVAELQSIVTMEAMATGKPVIAANVMALPLLVHEGVNGYLFESGDVETLAARLTELLTNQYKRRIMGQRSLEIIATHSISNTLAAYEQLYEEAKRSNDEQSFHFRSTLLHYSILIFLLIAILIMIFMGNLSAAWKYSKQFMTGFPYSISLAVDRLLKRYI